MQQDFSIVHAINRTTKVINFTFDGVPGVVVPGYKVVNGVTVPAGRDGQPEVTPLSSTRAEYARRQNVKMGTEDRDSGEAEFLVGVAERLEDGTLVASSHWPYNDISFTERGSAVERLDRSKMAGPDAMARAEPATGFPRGRQGVADAPFQFQDGPIATEK
jgi:hypothetical protein